MEQYSLTVYLMVGKCLYIVAEKDFESINELIEYCADFNTDGAKQDGELIFDVLKISEDSIEQLNVNSEVELIKSSRAKGD